MSTSELHHPRTRPHKDIHAIHLELHERVSLPVPAPSRVRHSAYLLPDDSEASRAEVRTAFYDVLAALGIAPQQAHQGQRAGSAEKRIAGGNTLRLRWELHTEFYSYTTINIPGAQPVNGDEFVQPFRLPAFPTIGTKLIDLDMLVVSGEDMSDESRASLLQGTIYGGSVVNGAARAWTTFQVDEWAQARYVIAAGSLKPGRLGRLVSRLIDIETYYHLILLPLVEYRGQVPLLRQMERRIGERSSEIAAALTSREMDAEAEHQWLVYLTQDLANLIQLTERMRYRLSAANSYFAIFEERLDWIREETGAGYQTMREFLIARVSPAVRNYRNFIERADALTMQLTALGNMMRTRVNMSMEAQSLQTMQAMNKRVSLQLKLQRTVEGLSLIVLSYYLTNLAHFVFEAAEPVLHLPGNPTVWAALTIPLWLLLSFMITFRVKAQVRSADRDARHEG
ncbi:MAG: DUF3422 domain-containing protein [Candidatus Lambdaproteobacteria bacterium]|nr:DUF3422 domain-containing protein [Candidatus Lambdaproteobacteria bacterium]